MKRARGDGYDADDEGPAIKRARDEDYEADDEEEPDVNTTWPLTEYQRFMLLQADDWTPVDHDDPELGFF